MVSKLSSSASMLPSADEPIAVIGVSCRLPRAAGPEAFWQSLRQGSSAIAERPADRRDKASGTWDGSREYGGFLPRVDEFDAGFFGISPEEASAMDPQQRLALELAWESLEDAGITDRALRGSRTGVFVGVMAGDYATLAARLGTDDIGPYSLTGTARGLIANRISHTLGLRGPSFTIDAAQASSLVAVHVAGESLRRGESDLALVGGVSLALAADSTAAVAALGALSPQGRSAVFDAEADGYVRGEGGAVVVLKRLAEAVADGDTIYCVIRGSAVNNGSGDRLTDPLPAAQEDVLRRAYAAAGVEPASVQYVELHGTGTVVGDPVEATALGAVLGAARPVHRPLLVGSAKSNVGHLEGAAGIVGFIKTVLCLRHRELPPSLHFRSASPRIPLTDLNLKVHTELGPWPEPDQPLVAGVSSFGISGTNAHVVLEQAPVDERDSGELLVPAASDAGVSDAAADTSAAPGVVPWVVSGRSAGGLR
ncbi:beta-ketoacyl synthase N-terminal-like domain-containing protein, partial [Streptomyces sp. NPDC002519]